MEVETAAYIPLQQYIGRSFTAVLFIKKHPCVGEKSRLYFHCQGLQLRCLTMAPDWLGDKQLETMELDV